MNHCFKIFIFFTFFCLFLHGKNEDYADLLKNSLPEQKQALEEAKSFFKWDADTQFQSLSGGLTKAKIYTFKQEDKNYILRFLALSPNHSKEMRQNEIQAMEIGHKLGIAPACVFSDQKAILMVMPLIKGHSLQHPNDFQILQMGRMLKSLHNYSGPYPTRYFFRERLKQHYQKGIEFGIAYPTGFDQEVKKVMSRILTRSCVPSHGDLNPSNILIEDITGKISLIDWTTATWEDPFFDLSMFCLLSNLSVIQEEIFLEAYFGRKPLEKECQILKEEKANVCLLTAVIWLRFSETREEVLLPSERRVTALNSELKSSNLKSIEDYLKNGIIVDLNKASKLEIKSYALSFYKAYLENKNK